MQHRRPDLDERLIAEIISIARAGGIRKVILYGSRARGDNRERSDIDLAVSGGCADDFRIDVDEKTHTLLSFDVADLDGRLDPEFARSIARDGVVLYEQA